MNLGHLGQVGVLGALDLPAALEDARLMIGAEPVEWLDLHAITPAAMFRDDAGHLHPPGCDLVAVALDDALRKRGL